MTPKPLTDISGARAQAGDAGDVEGLAAVEAQGLAVGAIGELQRDDTHADEVGAVDALEAFGDDGADAKQTRALRGPVA